VKNDGENNLNDKKFIHIRHDASIWSEGSFEPIHVIDIGGQQQPPTTKTGLVLQTNTRREKAG
jgi:hypothetical protein